jgi:GMP synthase (glutamine-hydrolysing)
MTRIALVLRHVHFEDLGSFEEVLMSEGYEVRYSDVGSADFCSGDSCSPELLVILGGPIGANDDTYPFLEHERRFIARRLAGKLPTLGICLGAQLIAAALGGRVYPADDKEIGFSRLRLTPAGLHSPLRHLDGVDVLHWHGDTYSLPAGAANLASTELTEQQAFSLGRNVLGIQFHPEVQTGVAFERWLVGHACELRGCAIDVPALRTRARDIGTQLQKAARHMLREWLATLDMTG